jgi:GntR family transcriptional regulator
LATQFFNPFPKYLQIRDILRRRIGRGLLPGDRMPTEHALVGQFGVSRETVREALRGLEEDGLIKRWPGRGTVVVKLPDPRPEQRLTGLVDDFTELKLNTKAEVLSHNVEFAPPEIAAALSGSPDEPRYRIRRRRLLDGVPLAHHDGYMPVDIGMALVRLDLRRTTLLREITTTLNLTAREDYQHIDATTADTEMAELLCVAVGAPLLAITRVFDIDSRGPSVFFRSHFRSDRYYYTVQRAQSQRRRTGTRPNRKKVTS